MIGAKQPRQGALIICVLVCLLVASSIVTATTQLASRSRRDVRVTQQMRQTELLLDAGILRAARQLQESADYAGESWRPSDAIPQFGDAEVEIRVTVDTQHQDVRQVEVIASLGVDSTQPLPASRTRRSHRFQFQRSNVASHDADSTPSESSSAE